MNGDGNRTVGTPLSDGQFHLFAYGTLRSGEENNDQIADCALVRAAFVEGTLYDIDGLYPALMLYGTTRVEGEIWRCPADRLAVLDRFEGLDNGLFRRVAVLIEETPCWTYVAGPALAHRLTPDRRLNSGRWSKQMQDAHE